MLKHCVTTSIGIIRDPVTVAAVAGMVHIRDTFRWGILPASCWQEIMGAAAAQISCAISGQYEQMEQFRSQLAKVSGKPDQQRFSGTLPAGHGLRI